MRTTSLIAQARRTFAKGGRPSWDEFKRSSGKFGKDTHSAEYEKEKKQKMETKMNWGIKNRWEQRALDDVIKNKDVRHAQFRNISLINEAQYSSNIQDFQSVQEIFFYLDEIFTAGFDEKTINVALDVFLRDFG